MHAKKKLTIRIRVSMEPELEEIAGHLDPAGRRQLGRKFSRWHHQLVTTACVIEEQSKPRPQRGHVPWVPQVKAKRN